MRSVVLSLSVVMSVGMLSGCASVGPTVSKPAVAPKGAFTEMASYYAQKFHGRPTASGEIFDINKMTAAHKKLKFGTYVRVTNLKNGKTVKVKINDRGPFVKGRVIDLSPAAARKIDMMKDGIVDVEVEIL